MHIAIPCLAGFAGAALGLRFKVPVLALATPLAAAIVTGIEFSSGAPWRTIALSVALAATTLQFGYLLAVLRPCWWPLRSALVAVAALSLIFVAASTAHAGPIIKTGEYVLAPFAFSVFCLKYPADCEAQGIPSERAVLTSERIQELAAVNTLINRSIRPQPNLGGLATEKWLLYPTSGECHDYALTKRHELLARAWPGLLLIAVVRIADGQQHAVLVVPTDRGDLVLDSLRSNVVRWDALPYQWLKIMSSENPKFWRRIQSLAPVHSGAAFLHCTDTIYYVATDQSGLTATSTRTVIIEPAQAPSIIPSNDASSTTTTAATIAAQ